MEYIWSKIFLHVYYPLSVIIISPWTYLRLTMRIYCQRQFRAMEFLFPELLILFSDSSHISCGITYLLTRQHWVVKMRFKHLNLITSVTVSCSNNPAISPTDIQSTFQYTTPHIDHIYQPALYSSSWASIELGHRIIHSLVSLIPPSGATNNSQMAPSTSDSKFPMADLTVDFFFHSRLISFPFPTTSGSH